MRRLLCALALLQGGCIDLDVLGNRLDQGVPDLRANDDGGLLGTDGAVHSDAGTGPCKIVSKPIVAGLTGRQGQPVAVASLGGEQFWFGLPSNGAPAQLYFVDLAMPKGPTSVLELVNTDGSSAAPHPQLSKGNTNSNNVTNALLEYWDGTAVRRYQFTPPATLAYFDSVPPTGCTTNLVYGAALAQVGFATARGCNGSLYIDAGNLTKNGTMNSFHIVTGLVSADVFSAPTGDRAYELYAATSGVVLREVILQPSPTSGSSSAPSGDNLLGLAGDVSAAGDYFAVGILPRNGQNELEIMHGMAPISGMPDAPQFPAVNVAASSTVDVAAGTLGSEHYALIVYEDERGGVWGRFKQGASTSTTAFLIASDGHVPQVAADRKGSSFVVTYLDDGSIGHYAQVTCSEPPK